MKINRRPHTQVLTVLGALKREALLSFLLLIVGLAIASAHGPLSMTSPESAGRDAFDTHIDVHQVRSLGASIEQQWGFGFTKNFGVHVGAQLPYFNGKVERLGAIGLGGKWRFWNKDTFGSKQALAVGVMSHFHPDRNRGTRRLSLGDELMSYLTYAHEQRHSTIFADARVQYVEVQQPEPEPATTLSSGEIRAQDGGHSSGSSSPALDGTHPTKKEAIPVFGVGAAHRFLDIPQREIDAMLFLGLSYRGGSRPAQLVSPELWFQPNGRMLLKFGYQHPVYQREKKNKEGGTWAYGMEIRF